jgi:HIRAN domain
MLSRFFKTRLEWRRTAVYQPVLVESTTLTDEEEAGQQSVLRACQVGVRVALARQPRSLDPSAVAVVTGGEQVIGYLPRDVGESIAPLIDSGRVAFDAEIWSLEKTENETGRESLACRLILTQHDFVPVVRFALTDWLFGDREASGPVAMPRGVRDSG